VDYFARSERFDMALDLTAGRKGLAALAEVMTRWLRHLLLIDVTIEPLVEVREAHFTWYVGLDADGTRIGDRLWHGEEPEDAMQRRLIGLFTLTFRDRGMALEVVGDEPVYLILAMSTDRILRMKPQNLITGLPLRRQEAVS
jgi:hypothetical protein